MATLLASPQASAFIARTSGLDASHISAYTVLISGLVADGVWAKLDVLYVFGTQDSTTALLNLVSSSYTAVSHGAPTFSANNGFTGVDGGTSSANYFDTGFNMAAGGAQNYTQNAASLSVWGFTNSQSSSTGGCAIGCYDGTNLSQLVPWYSDGNCYVYCNVAGATGGAGVPTVGKSTGFISGVRVSNGSSLIYRNAVSQTLNAGSGASAGTTPVSLSVYVLARHDSGGASSATAVQIAMASIGGLLTQTDQTNFYNRLTTYFTSVRGSAPPT